jgi:catechol 2,3-dioxygenase-like lactoylglutathione lyase family enzyme
MTSAFATAMHDHVAIRVADFDATVRWYADKLGFAIDRQWTAPSYAGNNLRPAYLRLNDVVLEIVGGGKPRPSRDAPTSVPELFAVDGYNHLCIRVDDVDAAKDELEAKGIEVYAGPNTSTILNRRFLHFRDLNGLSIEFVQYLP